MDYSRRLSTRIQTVPPSGIRRFFDIVATMKDVISLGIGELVGTHHATVDEMMQEMLVHERRGVTLYEQLLAAVEGRDVSLEEFARGMIRGEHLHLAEIEKMARKRGDA